MKSQVLSNSVAKGLVISVGPKAQETARFAEMFDKFFDCLNCSSLSAGKRSRNPFKSPYRSATDWKLKVNFYCKCHFLCKLRQCNFHVTMCTFATCVQWLTEVFLPYLDEWETSVSERSGFTKTERGMMLLSRETRLGLRITGWLQVTKKFTQTFM